MKKLLAVVAALVIAAGVALVFGRLEWTPLAVEAQRGPVYAFKVEIDGVTAGAFRSVDGLAAEIEVIEFVDGGDLRVRKRPGRVKYGDITLKRGYIANSQLFDWVKQIERGELAQKIMTISLMDGERVVEAWDCFECFPKSWSGPSQVGEGAALAIEKIEVAIEKVERAR